MKSEVQSLDPSKLSRLLFVQDVYKWYAEKLVLENLDLAVTEGTFCSVVGPSGCGNACASRAQCVNGQCKCPQNTTICGNTCVDLNSDANNCGGCRVVCPGGTCSAGYCSKCVVTFDDAGIANVCGLGTPPPAPLPLCTATNVSGNPYSGTLCGGAFIDNCSPGALYTCTGGARGTINNCTLAQTCSTGCLTGVNDTPVTANIGFATPVANDVCFADTAPLTLSTNATTGGNYVTLTATLTQPHGSAFVNFEGATLDVPPLCGNLIPLTIAAGATSVSWVQPTNVVTTPTTVPLNVLISYIEVASGRLRNLVSVSSPLTLNPGGTLPAPPLVSFGVTDLAGTLISTITGGTNAFTSGTLSPATPAPVGGTRVTVTSNPASAFVSDGSFVILPGCTTNSDVGVLTATSGLLSNLPATVSATTGAGATLTQNVIVTPPALQIQSVTLAPGAVIGGGSLTATVTLNRVVLARDASSTVSVRVSEGSPSNVQVATFAGCTGTPACSGSFTVPIGANSASVTISTSAVSAQQFVTVSASAAWSNGSASAQLPINPAGAPPPLSSVTLNPTSVVGGNPSTGTVTLTAAAAAGGAVVTLASTGAVASVPASVTVPAGATSATFTITTPVVMGFAAQSDIIATFGGVGRSATLTVTPSTTACMPTTCAAQGKTCGAISDGCGGTLTCGACTAPQTCGGGGIANVCGLNAAPASAVLTVTATGRAGELISSSPAGLNVNVGTSGSASFTTGTSVTLTVSNGRDAIWSGGCSSGGAKVKSCTVTINAATSVTANVQ